MRRLAGVALLAAALFTSSAAAQSAPAGKPTIVLVHGAFAESASWNPVITKLLGDGYNVIAVANPLRGVQSDAAYLSAVVSAIPGPVVLVGHSYGGEVISGVSDPAGKVRALVFVSGLAPDIGESAEYDRRAFSRGHARTGYRSARPATRWRQRPLHSPGQISRTVRCRSPGQRCGRDGGDAAPGDRRRFRRACHYRSVEDHPVLVHLRLAGPEYHARRPRFHGKARPRQRSSGDSGFLARRDAFPSQQRHRL